MKLNRKIFRNRRGCLVAAFIVAAAGLVLSRTVWEKRVERPEAAVMRRAARKAEEWFGLVREEKEQRGITSDSGSNIRYKALIGDEWSDITTTLGSLEAKEAAAEPDFAALMVKWLLQAGIDSTSSVGITLSGSFPSLAISSLAALHVLGAEAVVVSSLGSSTYGANQPEATWIDIESWLGRDDSFRFRSSLVTRGAENDSGGGLSEHGIEVMEKAAGRTGISLYVPDNLLESIRTKTELFLERGIGLLINIGGNQSSLGGCPHAYAIPTGFHQSMTVCSHENKGVIPRMSEKGVPFVHLLNIREISSRNCVSSGGCLYNHIIFNNIGVYITLFLIVTILIICYNDNDIAAS
ncbi:MAG: poly-gamma-glutamate system protein [Candidatus Latescibacteria bacterium]|nr:poly-gamma-glutamate system protein [bacterium]MBD3425123.1 poly-gamma-glutamate system protein [Candidatus Latescibacterota bacterium]